MRYSHFFYLVFVLFLGIPCRASSGATECTIVATTTILADTAQSIVGSTCTVQSLMPPGVDPHLFSPSPQDLRTLMRADLIIHNGLHLEGKMSALLSKLAGKKLTLEAARDIPVEKLLVTVPGGTITDPHVWLDVSLWQIVSQSIYDTILKTLPIESIQIAQNFHIWMKDLETLDQWAKERIKTIPTERRILVTAHDAFQYFGRAYDIEVMAIQGISTDSEASLSEINTLVSTLSNRSIPAVFIENTISPRSIEALIAGTRARNHPIQLGGELFGDALGDKYSPGETYQKMIRHNVNTIVSGLTATNNTGGNR